VLEHLSTLDEADFSPEVFDSVAPLPPLERATPAQHLDARHETADWLKSLGVKDDDEVATEAERRTANEAFAAMTANADTGDTHALITRLDTPPAVKHLVGMLTAFDWQFVERAQEIRGYAVAQLLEETKHPDAKIRLKALELLGKVTEVALFTERMEIKNTNVTDDELDRKIKEKLEALEKISDAEIIEETQSEVQ
jgi:hypothetical protein